VGPQAPPGFTLLRDRRVRCRGRQAEQQRAPPRAQLPHGVGGGAPLAVGHGRTRHRESMLAEGVHLGHRAAAAAPADLYEARVELVQLERAQLRLVCTRRRTLQPRRPEAATRRARGCNPM
jgi:hypothetical protein